MHLLIPFACINSSGAHQALQGTTLPHLEKLLSRMSELKTDQGDLQTLSPPHERKHAHILGLLQPLPTQTMPTDGRIPWAAWSLAQSGRDPGNGAWALISPCHWTVNSDHIVMGDPQTLGLSEAESRALLQSVQPYFEEDGIAIEYAKPDQWLAHSELFRGMASASVDRVAGANIDDWLPKTAQAAPLRRLQNEMQMLLYTHPVNDERIARGLQTVNSFWVSGTGALPERTQPVLSSIDPLLIASDLRNAAIAQDWAGWIQAWKILDTTQCAALLREAEDGHYARLTLCGERHAMTLDTRKTGFFDRIKRRFGHQPLYSLRDKL